MYTQVIKPFFDIFFAAFFFVLAIPVFLLVAMGLCIANKGSVFFYQSRPGKNEQIFKIIKFKTMTDERDSKGNLLPDKYRLKSFGKFVRATSLDEIPQFINVLKGDMSLVGPRPLLPEYLPFYTQEQKKRHLVKPGLSGWAQVNGRNTISWEKKLEYYSWYVEHQSFLLDIKILMMTLLKVLKSDGINEKEHITIRPFDSAKTE